MVKEILPNLATLWQEGHSGCQAPLLKTLR